VQNVSIFNDRRIQVNGPKQNLTKPSASQRSANRSKKTRHKRVKRMTTTMNKEERLATVK
jgi:hypothetical protein